MITLLLAFHNHQPVGNFDWVIEEAYQKSYLPLMRILGRHPEIRFAQHYTGILLDWFGTHHPEFIERIGDAVGSGQVELLSGGYYEPILAMLPERDRQMQIGKLNQRIASQFGETPSGMWLAERVWEPSLPSTLHDAGIRYTILDDTHFKAAGLPESALTGYFLTEDQGKPLAVFPIDKRLRYTMPFEAPEATFEHLHALDSAGENRVVVFADDGEKFGTWPDTYQTVYEEGWLEKFCTLLEQNRSWVRTMHPGEVVRTMKPAGRLYLPTASYAEMLHWALPTADAFLEYEKFEHILKDEELMEQYGAFVRGGFWRNFMVKYPEVNAMQKKMLRISERLRRLRENPPSAAPKEGTEKKATLEDAYNHLMASQCNCPYWHGVFGGLYLANIRSAMYREMITAERELDELEGRTEGAISSVDYDLDGNDELIYESRVANIYLAPARGGAIFEFDYKPSLYNFTDLLQRRREGYHAQLAKLAVPDEKGATGKDEANEEQGKAKSIHDMVRAKEAGLEKALAYDTYRHGLLIDHFYGMDVSAEKLRRGTLPDLGDFADGAYDPHWSRQGASTTITLRRAGTVAGGRAVQVEKAVSIEDGSADILVRYAVGALDGKPLEGRFGIEMAYAMSAGTEPDRYYEFDGRRPAGADGLLNSTGETISSRFALADEWLGVRIAVELERPGVILRAPVETISLSEEGFERNYQGSVLVAVWELGGASEWRMSLRQRFEALRPAEG